jgi:hypothetical protein
LLVVVVSVVDGFVLVIVVLFFLSS